MPGKDQMDPRWGWNADPVAKGKASALLVVLKARFGTLPYSTSVRLAAATHAQLETWLGRAAVVSTLDEVFSD